MPPRSHYPILTVADFEGMDGMRITAVAKKLCRTYDTVLNAVRRLGIRDRFAKRGGREQQKPLPLCRFTGFEGTTIKDAAYLAGFKYDRYRRDIHLKGIRQLFPDHGKAKWIGRKGYCDLDN